MRTAWQLESSHLPALAAGENTLGCSQHCVLRDKNKLVTIAWVALGLLEGRKGGFSLNLFCWLPAYVFDAERRGVAACVTDVDLQIIISMLMKVLNLKLFVSVSGSCRETIPKLSLYQAQFCFGKQKGWRFP